MCCKRCNGLVLEHHGQRSCCNCSWDPDLVLITVKCADVDCRMLPELNGYCLSCWHSRKRSELTDQERSKRYRDKERIKQRNRRAKAKESRCKSSTITEDLSGSSPEGICSGAMSAERGDSINQGE